MQRRMKSTEDELALKLVGVSVRYRVPTEPIATLKELAIRTLKGRRVGSREFSALRNVDLDVQRGESLGIIGRNGAGKSTLLKVIARVLRPTHGRVWVRGNVAPLIELGAGFHPELTGRENILLNGAMLGFSRAQMEEKLSRIVEFAELADFIDAPLRTYSSGMTMRLGFAIASDVDPDILIIDEILAVGDEAFQAKCHARMQSFRERGATILFVSHALEAVRRLCGRVIWIDEGRIRYSEDADTVVEAYREHVAIGAHPTPSPESA
jgi:ABC-2 type transport system ATP-binding protein/lipopolysaccharide transport system ATP-binding protein